ncbi:hypothetical protein [Flavivirga eckloniae]|uniref:Holliday junction resolvase RuvC n=1 Tax=Flavivirga eckloniae TaxID=1803846 RepID=A0A2K9PPU1_9FLAO|nr:hypothetical protein [Flavivirga eckloniae]AUP79093.1 hypothetical protein C1H87_10425 [Flavivirga eckloniae]
MDRKGTKTVLAFYPNQLGFGFAIMENALTPKDYRIVVSRPMSNKYLLKRMKELIAFYEPEIVLLEDIETKRTRKSVRVQKLITSIVYHAKTNNIPVAQYTRAQIREVFLNFNAKSKYQIASTIAQNIPALKNRLRPKRKLFEAEPYTMGIFDSISLAITHYYLTD